MKTMTQRSIKNGLMFAVVANLLVFGMLPKAHAGSDGKHYPGWMCQAQNSDKAQYLRYQYNGGIANVSSTYIYILCPIVRDSVVYKGDNIGIHHAGIFYSDNHPTDRIKCEISSRKAISGTIVDLSHNRSPYGIKAGSSFRIYGPTKVTRYAKHSNDFYMMRCVLPAKTNYGSSILQGYYIQESTD